MADDDESDHGRVSRPRRTGAAGRGARGSGRRTPSRRSPAAATTTSRPGPDARRCARPGSWRGPCARPAASSRACPRPPRPRRRGSAAGRDAPEPAAARSAAAAGSSASTIVLSPGSALPRICTPATPALDDAGPLGRRQRRPLRGRLAHLEEERPVQRPGRAADRGHQRHAGGLEERPERDVLRRSVRGSGSFAATACMPRSMLTPWSASPMAASSSVSSSRRAATSAANACSQAAAAAASTVAGRGAHAPHRRPGVSTGASHSRVSSSSSRSSVIEQPAMSSEVM